MTDILARIAAYDQQLGKQLPERLLVGRSIDRKTGTSLFRQLAERTYRRAVEISSGLGISPAYVAAALQQPGVLYVIESNSERAAIAEKALARLTPPGSFFEIVQGSPTRAAPQVFADCKPDYIHLVVDTYSDMTNLFDLALAFIQPGGMISGCFKGSPGLRSALAAIREHSRICEEHKIGNRVAFIVT